MMALTLGLLLLGAVLLLIGGYVDGNVSMMGTAELAPPAAAIIRRRKRLYFTCMVLSVAGMLSMLAVLGMFSVFKADPALLQPSLWAASGYAALAALLLAIQAFRLAH